MESLLSPRNRAVGYYKGLRTQNSSTNSWNLNNGSLNNNNKNNNNSVLCFYELVSLFINMKEYVTFKQLYIAYKDCRRHKRNKASALEFEMNLHENLLKLYEDLNNGTYEIGVSTAFVITKPKYREVFAASFRDRVVHHLLIRRLEPYLESYFDDSSYACRKGKGTLYGIKDIERKIRETTNNYTEEAWILKIDISSFFMSINKDILSTLVSKFMYRHCQDWEDLDWWVELAKMIINNRPELNCERHGNLNLWNQLPKEKSLFNSNGKGIPIGNLSSLFFANLYNTLLDRFLRNQGLVFGRYADDTIIIDRNKLKLLNLIPKIRKFIKKNLDLELHPDKVYLQSSKHGVIAFGTIINGHGILLPGKRTIGNTYNVIRLEEAICKGDYEKRLNKVIMRINSYFGFLVNSSSFNLRVKIMKKLLATPFGSYLDNKGYRFVKLKQEFKNII